MTPTPQPKALEELIGEYWDIAWYEGSQGRNIDTQDGAAQRKLSEIMRGVDSLRAEVERLRADAERMRQWFDCIQDVYPAHLEKEDYVLAAELYKTCGMRVPRSISSQVDAAREAKG